MGVHHGRREGSAKNQRPTSWRNRRPGEFLVASVPFQTEATVNNLLSIVMFRSFPRRKRSRSVWHINTSSTRICCRSLPTIMCYWPSWTRMSGHWRAGHSAPRPVGEVSAVHNDEHIMHGSFTFSSNCECREYKPVFNLTSKAGHI